jgi:hypothetical protein
VVGAWKRTSSSICGGVTSGKIADDTGQGKTLAST